MMTRRWVGLWSWAVVAVACAEPEEETFAYESCEMTTKVPDCIDDECVTDEVTELHHRWLQEQIEEAGLQSSVWISELEHAAEAQRLHYALQWQVGWLREATSGVVELDASPDEIRETYREHIADLAEDMPRSVINLEDVVRIAKRCGFTYTPCASEQIHGGELVAYEDSGVHCVGPTELRIDLATGDNTCTHDTPASWGGDCE